MPVSITIYCDDEPQEVVISEDGSFVFVGYDFSEDLTLEEMGYEPTDCLRAAQELEGDMVNFLLGSWTGLAFNAGIEDIPGTAIEYILDCFEHVARQFGETVDDWPQVVMNVITLARAHNMNVDNVELEESMWIRAELMLKWLRQYGVRSEPVPYDREAMEKVLNEYIVMLKDFLKYILNEDNLLEDMASGDIDTTVSQLRIIMSDYAKAAGDIPDDPTAREVEEVEFREETWQLRRLLQYLEA